MAEYNSNDYDSETTGVSPFFTNCGYNPRFQANTRPENDLSDARTRRLAITIQDIQNKLKDIIAQAQDFYREMADGKQLPAP